MRQGALRPGWRVWLGWLLVAVVLLGLLALPNGVSGYHVTVTTRILIMALFGVAFNLVFGMAGRPAFGHAAFFGTGGYVVGLSFLHWDFGLATILALVVVVCGLLGLVFGLLTRRANGIYLLLLTLALAQAVWGLAFQQVSLTRGDNGIAGIGRDIIPLFPTDSTGFYYFTLIVVTLGIAILRKFARSPVGRIIVGTRESPTRMAAAGYHVGLYRDIAFVVSAVFSGIAGSLLVLATRFAGPELLNWPITANVWIMTILGGAGTFFGPALGAGAIIGLETWVSGFTDRWVSVLGALFIVTIVFLPDGVLGRLAQLVRRRSVVPDDEPSEDGTSPAVVGSADEGKPS